MKPLITHQNVKNHIEEPNTYHQTTPKKSIGNYWHHQNQIKRDFPFFFPHTGEFFGSDNNYLELHQTLQV